MYCSPWLFSERDKALFKGDLAYQERLYLEADTATEIVDHFSCTNLLWLRQTGRQENSRGQGECERGCGCIQGEGRVTRALSTTITPPHIHDSALGLPSQLLGQLSNQVSRLFLRPPWSIVPSPRLVCGPQLWLNDVISDPKAGRVSRRKHGAGGGGAPTGDNEPGEVMPIFLMISALLTGNEKKKACFPNPRFHVCHFFSASGGLSTRWLRNKQKKKQLFIFVFVSLF